MSLSASAIIGALTPVKNNTWFSRNDDGVYDNVSEISLVKEGDIAWFSADASSEDLEETRKALAMMNLHLYSKDLAESKKNFPNHPDKWKIRRSESGAFSFVVLPNQGSRVEPDKEDAPF
jgi:hypothetical protein